LSNKYEFIKGDADKRNKPTLFLTSEIYGSMDGATVIKKAILAYRKNQALKTK
jgi:PTS system cellobiose-specific IIB component